MSVLVKSGGGENVTPEVQAQSPLVTEILESLVGKVTLANATPETILEGYSAYVGQRLIQGTRPDVSRSIDFGTVTLSEQVATITVGHNLKVIPKYVILMPELGLSYDSTYTWFIIQAKFPILSSNVDIYGWYHGSTSPSTIQAANQFADTTDSSITFKSNGYAGKFFKTTYPWIAMA